MTERSETTPRRGDRCVHVGVTTTTQYDANGVRSVTGEPFSESGVLLDVGPDDRCTVLFDDGVEVDNIYIGALSRLGPRKELIP